MQSGILLVACLFFDTISAKTYLVQTKDKGGRQQGSLPTGSDYSANGYQAPQMSTIEELSKPIDGPGYQAPQEHELIRDFFPSVEIGLIPNDIPVDPIPGDIAAYNPPSPASAIPELFSFSHGELHEPEDPYKKEDEADAEPAVEEPASEPEPSLLEKISAKSPIREYTKPTTVPELLSFPHRESHKPENPYGKKDEADAEPAIEEQAPESDPFGLETFVVTASLPSQQFETTTETVEYKTTAPEPEPESEPVYAPAEPEPESEPVYAPTEPEPESEPVYAPAEPEPVSEPVNAPIEPETSEPEPEAEAGEVESPYGKK